MKKLKSICNASVFSCLSPWPTSTRRIYPVLLQQRVYTHNYRCVVPMKIYPLHHSKSLYSSSLSHLQNVRKSQIGINKIVTASITSCKYVVDPHEYNCQYACCNKCSFLKHRVQMFDGTKFWWMLLPSS